MARSGDGIEWQDSALLTPLSGSEADRFGHVTPHLVRYKNDWRLFVGAAARQSWDGNAIAEVKIENLIENQK